MVAKVCLNVPAALGLPPSRQGHLSQAPFPLRRPPLGAGTQDLPAPVLAAHPGLGDAFPPGRGPAGGYGRRHCPEFRRGPDVEPRPYFTRTPSRMTASAAARRGLSDQSRHPRQRAPALAASPRPHRRQVPGALRAADAAEKGDGAGAASARCRAGGTEGEARRGPTHWSRWMTGCWFGPRPL